MKKVLFATTALVATAGIASADVSLSGAANFGVVNNGTTGADAQAYNNASVKATMSGATDNGLSFGVSLTMRNGDDVDLDAGDLGDNDSDNDGDIDQLSGFSMGGIFVSGAFGKITFEDGGIDNVHNDDFSHDVQYDYSVGALSVSVTADIDNNGGTYADGEQWAAKVSYAMAPLTVTLATDDSSETDTTVAYKLNDTTTVSVNYDSNGQTSDAETTVKAAYSANGLSASLSLMDDDDDAWAASLGYTMNALTVGASLGELGADGDTEMDLTASYSLGGGMTIKAATNETGAYFVGTALSF